MKPIARLRNHSNDGKDDRLTLATMSACGLAHSRTFMDV